MGELDIKGTGELLKNAVRAAHGREEMETGELMLACGAIDLLVGAFINLERLADATELLLTPLPAGKEPITNPLLRGTLRVLVKAIENARQDRGAKTMAQLESALADARKVLL